MAPPSADLLHANADPASTRRSARVVRLTLLFTLSIIGIIVALEGARLWHDYQRVIDEAGISAGNLARATAQHAEGALRQVDSVTGGISERIEGDGLANLNPARLHLLFKHQVEILPQLHGLFIYGANGEWLVTDKDQIPPNANNGDREYFAYHRSHPGNGLHIGPVITSRSTGEPVIPVSRRINNPDGSFAGVFLATMRLGFFLEYYAGFQIDEHGVFVLALADGTLLGRRPLLPNVIGTSLANSELFQDYLPRMNDGIADLESRIDGERRFVGFRKVNGYPLVVAAALSRQSVLAPWKVDVFKTALVLGVLGCGIGLFGAGLMRQFSYRIAIEHELRGVQLTLSQMAFYDGLTGLANRRKLDTALEDELNRARRLHYPMAMIMLDLDRFKLFNDRYGHPAGDDCLKAVAAVLAATVHRTSDLAVRYGGEELALLLPNTPFDGACKIADDLLDGIRALRIEHLDNGGIVTASLGVYVCEPGTQETSPAAMIKAADALLYAAKHSGRNRWRAAGGSQLAQSGPAV
ncbi:sensor domain-containing diguanylate cyclase [Pseudomonas sp. RIT-PI-S]|uniref:sensor domain-containing diguanylate cyclase n=1 Tax=Pseudomonas sp. RIT-PI-S TaxID=3035295 RepID=UPI0021DB42CD|nr:sensor domain-containing diguanylate cyclase [Pseudomonas sp. RIT-PI-S]